MAQVYNYRSGLSSECMEDLGRHLQMTGLGNGTTGSIIRSVRDERLYCAAHLDQRTGEEIVVLVTQRDMVGELVKHGKYA